MPTIQRQPRVKFAAPKFEHAAQHLMRLEARRLRLQKELQAIENEQRQTVAQLEHRYPDGVHFADPKGYEKELEFTSHTRKLLDQAAARRMLERLGKRIPLISCEIKQWHIKQVYITED